MLCYLTLTCNVSFLLILKEDCSGNMETVKVGAGHVAANTVRLLIAGSQAGGLIGVSGQNIENLRNSSGANITVLSPSQLPPYASAHESDRVVQVTDGGSHLLYRRILAYQLHRIGIVL